MEKLLLDKKYQDLIFNGLSIDQAIEELQEIKTSIENMGCDSSLARIEYDYYGYNNEYDVCIYFKRPETDKEFEKRKIKAEKEAKLKADKKKKAEEKERALFAKLQKKYGN